MTYTEYITKPGDRWDLIAYKAYGSINTITLPDGTQTNAMSLIIRSNPGLPVNDVLEEGLLLQVPIITNADSKTDNSLLPPWKR